MTATFTPTPDICPVQFESPPLKDNDYVFITGHVGSTVTIIDMTAGTTLGSDILVAVSGHACPGFADFSSSPLSPPLIANHVVRAQSSDGSFDTAVVLHGTPTPTATSTFTPIPTNTPGTPTNTPTTTPIPNTATPTITPIPADLVISNVPILISTPPIIMHEPVQFQVYITNIGEAAINHLFFVDIYFDPGTVTSQTIPISYTSGYAGVSYLMGGASRLMTITAPLGFTNATNPHTVYAMVDSSELVVESNEINNVTNALLVYVTPAAPTATSTPSPTPDPNITPTPTSVPGAVSGIVRRLAPDWIPQNRAIVRLLDENTGSVVAVTESDQNGLYAFNNVSGTFTVQACIEVDGVMYVGTRTGIIAPNPLTNIYMLGGPCS
jgi:hypothetical protein